MSSKFLEEKIVNQVKDFFQDLENPVKILFFGSSQENCNYCSDTLSLMEEIAELSELISIETYDIDKDNERAAQFKIKIYTNNCNYNHWEWS